MNETNEFKELEKAKQLILKLSDSNDLETETQTLTLRQAAVFRLLSLVSTAQFSPSFSNVSNLWFRSPSLLKLFPTQAHEQIYSITSHSYSSFSFGIISPFVSQPSLTSSTTIQWNSLLISEPIKQFLVETIILPFKFPQLFSGLKRPPPLCVLFFGPPGCSKRSAIKSFAFESGAILLIVDLYKIGNYEPDKKLKILFNYAKSLPKPCIMQICGLEIFCRENPWPGTHESLRVLLFELLFQLDNSHSENSSLKKVIGIITEPWKLDTMVRRRFEKRIFFKPSSTNANPLISDEKMKQYNEWTSNFAYDL